MEAIIPIPKPEDKTFVYPVSKLDEVKPLIELKEWFPALIIPSRRTADVRKKLKQILMNKPKLRDIYNLTQDDVAVNPNPDGTGTVTTDIKMERKIVLTNKHETYPDIYKHPAIEELLNDSSIRASEHEVILGYDHFVVDEVLTKILPKELSEIPSSFEVIGHLAHITLREEYQPYKLLIGQTILDKNKGIKVVVNKVGTIQNEFRTFPMEILADDRKKVTKQMNESSLGLIVEVKEDGCRFQLDFEKVYWNSRLQYEHRRIVHLITDKPRPTNVKKRPDGKKKSIIQTALQETKSVGAKIIVADACAGIGPFAVPLTSQYDNVEVYANDLNPISYRYLQSNAKLNKCGKLLHSYNMDGRYFLRKLDDDGVKYDHVLMNLPAIAPEFLNVFSGWKGDYSHRPMIHVHCFASKVEGDIEAVKRCSRSLGCDLDMLRDEIFVHEVRNVSPKKNMYCVSFRLPEGVKNVERVEEFGAIATKDQNESSEEGEEQRAKRPRKS